MLAEGSYVTKQLHFFLISVAHHPGLARRDHSGGLGPQLHRPERVEDLQPNQPGGHGTGNSGASASHPLSRRFHQTRPEVNWSGELPHRSHHRILSWLWIRRWLRACGFVLHLYGRLPGRSQGCLPAGWAREADQGAIQASRRGKVTRLAVDQFLTALASASSRRSSPISSESFLIASSVTDCCFSSGEGRIPSR